MKINVHAAVLALCLSSSLFAAEECPVSKISLARGLASETLSLAETITESDTKIDIICLKLGRVTAIWRRTQGQLAGSPTAPVPPISWKTRAEEVEGFCGMGNNASLPRGLVHPEFLLSNQKGFKDYMLARVSEMTQWIQVNQDPENFHCPTPVKIN